MKKGFKLSDKQIDALFREAEENAGIPGFNPVYFEEMLLQTNPETVERKRKPIFWWFAASSLVFVFLGLVYFNFNTIKVSNFDQFHWTLKTSKESKSLETATIDSQKESNETIYFGKKNNQNSKVSAKNFKQNKRYNNLNKIIIIDSNSNLKNTGLIDLSDKIIKNPSNESISEDIRSNELTGRTDLASVDSEKKLLTIRPFIQLSTGLGQGHRKIEGTSPLVVPVIISAGIERRDSTMFMSFGLGIKGEFSNDLQRVQDFQNANGQNVRIIQDYQQLYSLNFPLQIGKYYKKHNFGIAFTPGFQLIAGGKETELVANTMTRSERFQALVPTQSTLTMGAGINYGYSFNENYQFNVQLASELLRPFNSTQYTGNNRLLPMTLFFGIRRSF